MSDHRDRVMAVKPESAGPCAGTDVRPRPQHVEHSVEWGTDFGRDSAGGHQGRLWHGNTSLPRHHRRLPVASVHMNKAETMGLPERDAKRLFMNSG